MEGVYCVRVDIIQYKGTHSSPFIIVCLAAFECLSQEHSLARTIQINFLLMHYMSCVRAYQSRTAWICVKIHQSGGGTSRFALITGAIICVPRSPHVFKAKDWNFTLVWIPAWLLSVQQGTQGTKIITRSLSKAGEFIIIGTWNVKY